MNKGIKYSLIMISFGVVITFCLTLINLLTFPIIEKRKMEKVQTYLNSVTDGDWKVGEHIIDISENNYIEEVLSKKVKTIVTEASTLVSPSSMLTELSVVASILPADFITKLR